MVSQFLIIIDFSNRKIGGIANSVVSYAKDFQIASHIHNTMVISNLRKFCISHPFKKTPIVRMALNSMNKSTKVSGSYGHFSV